eukprot:GEMP01009468.1.p1 GENE.GEMP01009468.1~~GEMP01009468.1.p1  ORF type:complete len:275 (-),score=57.05 GEMP01009468.1:2503-3327(-)
MKRRFEARKRKKEALSIEAAELAARTMKDLHFPMDTFAEPAPFPWDDVPTDLNPSAGALLDGRAMRKRHQLESLMRFVLPFLLPGDRCVDFGCGTGHYGLMVAYLRPDVSVVLVEREDGRAKMGRERMEALDLANCAFFHGSLEDYLEAQAEWDVGLGLHCCGLLTDKIVEACCAINASFVLCPCCYGQVGGKEGRTALPQSQALKNLGLTCEDFVKITSCADMDVVSQNGFDFEEDPKFYRAKVCMQTVDLDRLLRCMSYSESLPSISLNNAR